MPAKLWSEVKVCAVEGIDAKTISETAERRAGRNKRVDRRLVRKASPPRSTFKTAELYTHFGCKNSVKILITVSEADRAKLHKSVGPTRRNARRMGLGNMFEDRRKEA